MDLFHSATISKSPPDNLPANSSIFTSVGILLIRPNTMASPIFNDGNCLTRSSLTRSLAV